MWMCIRRLSAHTGNGLISMHILAVIYIAGCTVRINQVLSVKNMDSAKNPGIEINHNVIILGKHQTLFRNNQTFY